MHDLRLSLVTDSMRPLSWRISTTCLFFRDGDGFGSREGEAVEEEARDRKKALEEEVEVARRKVLEELG